MMRDPSNRVDWSDEIKYIPLGKRDGWYVPVGGESRPVYERYRNEDWGSQPQDLTVTSCNVSRRTLIFTWASVCVFSDSSRAG